MKTTSHFFKDDNTEFIRSLGLSNRASRCLAYLHVNSKESFANITVSEIKGLSKIGNKTIAEIERIAAKFGYKIIDDRCKEKEIPVIKEISPLAKYDPKSDIDVMGLTKRTVKTLKSVGINHISDLVKMYPYQLESIDGCGAIMRKEISDKITECGFEFAKEDIEDLGLSCLSLGFLRKKGLTSIQIVVENIDQIRTHHGRLTPPILRNDIIDRLVANGYLPKDFSLALEPPANENTKDTLIIAGDRSSYNTIGGVSV